ncbi:MAG: hypothetical protein ACE5HB_01270 [Terriglobia bacterium]
MKKWLGFSGVLVLILTLGPVWGLRGQAPGAGGDAELQLVVESFYDIAPGKADEWLELYRTQHLPILEERKREGHILEIRILRPFLHQGGPPWDFKVILTFRDFTVLGDRAHSDAIERRLYPEWDEHQAKERRRWEITEKHWDDLMVEVAAE